jgi:hypothetical protein
MMNPSISSISYNAYLSETIDWLQNEYQWPGLKRIGVVNSCVEKEGKQYQEQKFYISSLALKAND